MLDQAGIPLDDELTNLFMEAYATAISECQTDINEAAMIFFKLYVNMKLALASEEKVLRSSQEAPNS